MYVEHVVLNRSQVHGDLVLLDQREHVCEDLSMQLQAARVRSVGCHREDLHQNIGEICLVEALCGRRRTDLEVL